jgi:Tfp pilus assembly protein PilF
VLGFVALRQYKADEAMDAFTRAVDADPSFAMAWLGRGLAAIRRGTSRPAGR